MLKILLLLVSVLCWPAQALVLSPHMGLRESASLSGQLSVLRDASGQWQIEDVLSPAQAASFVTLTDFLSAGYTTDIYWLRFTLQRQPLASPEWWLEVSPPYLNDVTLFVPRGGGGFKATQLGDLHSYALRPVPHRSFVFPLNLPNDQPLTLYLRIKTSSTMLVRVQAWQNAGLLAQTQVDTGLYSVFFGILALALVSNLMYWFWLRERLYLIYCAYLAALALVTMATGGFLTQLFFPQSPLLGNRAVGVSVSLVYLLGTFFFMSVLHLREHFVQIKRVFDAVLLFYAMCLLAALAGWYGAVAPWLFLFALVTNAVVVMASAALLWRGHRQYRFYILAFAVNMAAVPFSIFKIMGWVTLPISTDVITIFGSLIHIVLLNYALIDRLRHAEIKMFAAIKQTVRLEAERDAVERQRKFVAMVSHEFRTPLAVIDATAQSVEIASTTQAVVVPEFIVPRQAKIRLAVRRMVTLLDNLLTSERLDSYDSKNSREVVDLRDLASEAARNWSHLLHSPDQLRLEPGDAPVPVLIDRPMVALALSNLIDNAIKYAPLSSPVTLRVGRTGQNGWIEVVDRGAGISSQEMALIFDKFYRSAEAQKVSGAGLGLHLVRSIAHSHGGEVVVTSTPGQGAVFRLRLALVRP